MNEMEDFENNISDSTITMDSEVLNSLLTAPDPQTLESQEDYQTSVLESLDNINGHLNNIYNFSVVSLVSIGLVVGVLLGIILQRKFW